MALPQYHRHNLFGIVLVILSVLSDAPTHPEQYEESDDK
jgi:hypothetical protein